MPVFELIAVTDYAGLEICKSIRRRVFIEEQGVDQSLEIDEYDVVDGKCVHYYLTADGLPVAACRMMNKGGGILKLQRFCVLRDYRQMGVGRRMIEGLEEISRREHYEKIEMGAQCRAVPFYEKCGYLVMSGVFMDAGIEHVKMEKRL